MHDLPQVWLADYCLKHGLPLDCANFLSYQRFLGNAAAHPENAADFRTQVEVAADHMSVEDQQKCKPFMDFYFREV